MIGPIDGSNQTPVNRIPVKHAVDYLRQHYAVEKGVDNMGYFHLGGDLKNADAEERASCEAVHQSARERARASIGGCLSGAKIPVWKETQEGELVPCGGQWAWRQVEQETVQADTLYFATVDWNLLLPHLTSEVSRRHFDNATAGHDNLALWLALELRRSRAAFDKSRKEQDADFEAKEMRKTGVRVKLTLKSASEVCVALADATITKAGEFSSTPGQLSEAEKAVLAFTREITSSAITLAFFVSGENGLGGSAVKAAKQRGKQLYADIEGAFSLAKGASHVANSQMTSLDELLIILCTESANIWEKERDRINSEFSKAGRVQSGYHIKALSEAAGIVATGLLDRAFMVAAPLIDYHRMKEFASSVFDPLAGEIIEIAVGKSGRMPQPDNAETAERFTGEARQRIGNKIALWRLEAEIKNDGLPTSPKVDVATNKKPAGRPKGAGAIDDSPHLEEMARLIEQSPALSVRAAAKALEPKAAQPNSDPESTIRRLKLKYEAIPVAK